MKIFKEMEHIAKVHKYQLYHHKKAHLQKIKYLMHELCCIAIILITVLLWITLDRCVAANCHADATCNKTTGYACVCNYGYKGNGSQCEGE
jgi:hypothetical protein